LVKRDIVTPDHDQVALRSPPGGRNANLLMGRCQECVIDKSTDFDRPGPEGMSGLSLGQV
jgi:hypothetical protein